MLAALGNAETKELSTGPDDRRQLALQKLPGPVCGCSHRILYPTVTLPTCVGDQMGGSTFRVQMKGVLLMGVKVGGLPLPRRQLRPPLEQTTHQESGAVSPAVESMRPSGGAGFASFAMGVVGLLTESVAATGADVVSPKGGVSAKATLARMRAVARMAHAARGATSDQLSGAKQALGKPGRRDGPRQFGSLTLPDSFC